MCEGMDCILHLGNCPFIVGALDATKGGLHKMAEAAADLSEQCVGRHGMRRSTAGMNIIHPGCPRVVAASKAQ